METSAQSQEKELSEEKKESGVIVQKEDKLLSDMRGLLSNYPYEIPIRNKEDTFSLVSDIILIYKLLIFCAEKSKKEEIQKQLKDEIAKLNDINIHELILQQNRLISSPNAFGESAIKRNINNIIENNLIFIINKIQFFLLALPFKKKRDMHPDTAHGLPAREAEEYERTEIERGEQIKDPLTQKWSVGEEGEVVPA